MEILNRYTGEVIFHGDVESLRCANLIDANLGGANLRGTNLRCANLIGANLIGANLGGANLRYANLRYANLRGANLRGANLRGANLTDANLEEANLIGANLWQCGGNRNEIKSIFISSTYPITYTSEVLQIGCESHNVEDWWEFDDARIITMDGKKALKFWRKYKGLIKNIIEVSPATPTGKE